MNGFENLVLSEIKILPLVEDKIMVLIGTITGYITETLDVSATLQECNDASKYLTNHFKGETIGFMIENIDQFEAGMQNEIHAFGQVVNSLIHGLKKLNNQKFLDIKQSGSAKLIEQNLEGAKKVLNVLENEKELSSILETKEEGKVEVTVAEEEDNCSVVKAPICVNGKQLASIGVIGPQRMDYASIASALKVVIDSLNEIKGE